MNRNWPGLIAFVLAISVGLSLVISITVVSIKPEPLDQPFGAVITTLAGAAVGAIATFLGINYTPKPPPIPPPEEKVKNDEEPIP